MLASLLLPREAMPTSRYWSIVSLVSVVSLNTPSRSVSAHSSRSLYPYTTYFVVLTDVQRFRVHMLIAHKERCTYPTSRGETHMREKLTQKDHGTNNREVQLYYSSASSPRQRCAKISSLCWKLTHACAVGVAGEAGGVEERAAQHMIAQCPLKEVRISWNGRAETPSSTTHQRFFSVIYSMVGLSDLRVAHIRTQSPR